MAEGCQFDSGAAREKSASLLRPFPCHLPQEKMVLGILLMMMDVLFKETEVLEIFLRDRGGLSKEQTFL